ncbi:MAG: flavodoxin domain-containing protein [Lachnospiraceae bacterium]|nr:flavodoxin domain-containing protein [Lachnospiraceae bacterium]
MKTLIVYYTLEGNTHYAAKKIASLLDADVLRVKPVKTYPRKGFRKFLWGGKSAVMAETPELEPYTFDASAYDRIVFGFPVWAGNVTPPLRTFIKENDLSGKRFAAFACQSGAGAEKAFEKLKTALGIRELDAELVLIDPKAKPDPKNEKKISGFCGKLK